MSRCSRISSGSIHPPFRLADPDGPRTRPVPLREGGRDWWNSTTAVVLTGPYSYSRDRQESNNSSCPASQRCPGDVSQQPAQGVQQDVVDVGDPAGGEVLEGLDDQA